MNTVVIRNLVKQLTPTRWRTDLIFLRFAQALCAPLAVLYDDLLAFDADVKYRTSFNGQLIYLEHYLNDQLDPTLRRIVLENNLHITATYIYRASEGAWPVYASSLWLAATTYVADDRVSYLGNQYKAIAGSTNKQPDTEPLYWELEEEQIFLFQQEEYEGFVDFYINLPDTYDSTATYNKGDVVYTDGDIWRAKENSITGAWDATKWADHSPVVEKMVETYKRAGRRYNFVII